jgi:hypothetical protein
MGVSPGGRDRESVLFIGTQSSNLYTVTKTCCGGACTHDSDPKDTESDVSSQTWCTRKNLCVSRNWQFKHATRIQDVIMLDYLVKVRPMPGMWVQSVPVTTIPWGRMKTEQRNLFIRSPPRK